MHTAVLGEETGEEASLLLVCDLHRLETGGGTEPLAE